MNENSQVIIERSGNDANILGKEVKIPQGQSALSFVDSPFMKNGDDYISDPLYVINKYTGKKRKQLINGLDYNNYGGDNFYVWKKIVEDPDYVPTLELRYIQFHKMYEKFLEEKYRPAVAELEKVGRAHCIPKHAQGKYWIYKYRSEPYAGFGFDWVDEKPETILNIEVGQHLYYVTHELGNKWSQRCWKFRSVFLRSLQNYFAKKFYTKERRDNIPAYASLVINGRTYLVQEKPHKYMSLDFVQSHEVVIL